SRRGFLTASPGATKCLPGPHRRELRSPSARTPVTTSSSTSTRLASLDVFRGLTIAAMILVSTPGTWDAVYWPLDHATWDGWTLADLVFPFFLFAMGAAVPVALARRRHTPKHLWRHVFRRAASPCAIGLAPHALG